MTTPASDATDLPEDEAPRYTRRLNDIEQRPRVEDDRIRELIIALGDPNHPQHPQAVAELVAIGPAAVGPLSAALSSDRPWLASYRAAEVLAQIGDGRASGALINALRHPNSNVRWSVVRALAEVGDTRTLWALRRVAHEDRGKTSWGESVADSAQLALDRLQSRSALMRFSEPVKTALVFVAMFAAMLFAARQVQAVLFELRADVPPPVLAFSTDAKETPEVASPAVEETPVAEAAVATSTPQATPAASVITSTVKVANGNVRSSPGLSQVIGIVNQGDELVFLGVSGDWYLVRLGDKKSENSQIRDGQGWVSRIVVNEPSQPVPTITATTTP
jgi:hypothetical protein